MNQRIDRSDLAALRTFVAIVDEGSFSAAARSLGVNPPAVSHQIKSFEDRLGGALLLRSTRTITLTDAGRALYDSSRHHLAAAQEALEALRNAAATQAGRLRISLPYRAWQLIIAPGFAAFHDAFPGIELDLTIDEALTDIVARGFHAGIRLGDHLQDDMIAVRLSATEATALVAAPDYLMRHGTPAHPADLLDHIRIGHRQISSGRVADWRLRGPAGEVSVATGGRLVFNDLRTVVDAARRGHGIGWSLKRGVENDLDSGALVEVLPGFTLPRPGFSLYFPKALQKHALLRAFIGHFRLG
jgi:DNA-binding transcriptional LysR family regulator